MPIRAEESHKLDSGLIPRLDFGIGRRKDENKKMACGLTRHVRRRRND